MTTLGLSILCLVLLAGTVAFGVACFRLKRRVVDLQARIGRFERLSSCLESCPEGLDRGVVEIDPKGRILDVSPNLEHWLPERWQGRLLREIVCEDERKRIDLVLAELPQQKTLTKVPLFQWFGEGGEKGRVHLTFSPILRDDRIEEISVLVDFVSPLLENIAYQEESFDRLQSLLLAVPDVLFTADEHGMIEYWNESAEAVTGYTGVEMQGRPWQSFMEVGADSVDLSGSTAASVELPHMMNRECTVVTRDGKRLTVLVSSGEVLAPDGQSRGSVTLLKDITAIKTLEAKLRRQQEDLLQANEDLEQLAAHQSRFLSHVSHELRTPLNSIIGFAGILLDGIPGPLTEEQKKQLNVIYRQSQRLLGQINGLLDVVRLKSKRVTLDLHPFAMEDVVTAAIGSLQPQAQKKSLELRFETPRENLPEVYADPGRVEQILVNLIGNAIKYTNQGQIWVECRISKKPARRLETWICDTGIGISPEQQAKMFEEFWQAETAKFQSEGGLGLGLAITKHLLELQGGSIRVKSQLGEGSRICFRLPLAGTEESRGEARAIEKRPTVAVVAEDSPFSRRLVKFLRQEGTRTASWRDAQFVARELSVSGAETKKALPVLIVDEPLWPSVRETLGDRQRAETPEAGSPACLVLTLNREGPDPQHAGAVYRRKPVSRRDVKAWIDQVQSHPKKTTATAATSAVEP